MRPHSIRCYRWTTMLLTLAGTLVSSTPVVAQLTLKTSASEASAPEAALDQLPLTMQFRRREQSQPQYARPSDSAPSQAKLPPVVQGESPTALPQTIKNQFVTKPAAAPLPQIYHGPTAPAARYPNTAASSYVFPARSVAPSGLPRQTSPPAQPVTQRPVAATPAAQLVQQVAEKPIDADTAAFQIAARELDQLESAEPKNTQKPVETSAGKRLAAAAKPSGQPTADEANELPQRITLGGKRPVIAKQTPTGPSLQFRLVPPEPAATEADLASPETIAQQEAVAPPAEIVANKSAEYRVIPSPAPQAYATAAVLTKTDAQLRQPAGQPVAYQPGPEEDLFGEGPQRLPLPPQPQAERALPDTPVEVRQRPNQAHRGMPFEIVTSSGELTVTRRRNKILRSENDIYRVAVVDETICDVIQFTPREVSIIGKSQGATSVTFWFADGSQQPVTYLIRVVPDPEIQIERERQYQILEEIVAELFPDSKVRLVPVADKLIVRGQAKGAAEAAQIMAVIRGETVLNGNGVGTDGAVVDGRAASPLTGEETGGTIPAANVINMLRIPGVQQVALKVKIAELNRSAAREFGIDLDIDINSSSASAMIQTLLNFAAGSTTSISGTFSNDDISFGIHYLQSHDVIRILSEPTLVTLSGRPASFLAGGEFAVPTVVGVDGASGIATDFRSFGVILNFLPTVIDKDRIRLEISPEFSQIDSDLAVDGTPGLSTRAVTTTVEMREGQAFAIAGLLEDSLNSETASDIPILPRLLGRRAVSHNETELLILVTPELVHPMEPEEVPPLPGFDVTEPTNKEFFLHGDIEGRPTREYRSTIWPRLRSRYRNGGPAMISGPYGHGQ